ncbi:MAG: sulfurtransferase TusA family protein [Chlorobiales bacterium]|jgi:tRNA 2-thiouridine synthesizing protein A|nr:sulfurtransferase TusA family protein [Chlorobiales bacterium]
MEYSVKESIDVKGVSCPVNFARIKAALALLEKDDLLEIFLDEGSALTSVSRSLKEHGHRLLKVNNLGTSYRMVIKK